MNLLVYCAGGLGKEILDVAVRINKNTRKWEEICFVDDDVSLGTQCYASKVFTFENALRRLDLTDREFVIATGEPAIRHVLFKKLQAARVQMATLIDPTAVISNTANLGVG